MKLTWLEYRDFVAVVSISIDKKKYSLNLYGLPNGEFIKGSRRGFKDPNVLGGVLLDFPFPPKAIINQFIYEECRRQGLKFKLIRSTNCSNSEEQLQ